ncbi:MAG: replicative DNA helicase, partial [Clostridia bacterium]|nr:replicative DNA helicase [Clostridia bacterium]
MSVALNRVPPQNIDAEQAVLGAMMLDRDTVFQVVGLLRPVDFYKEAHRVIFEKLLTLSDKGDPVDLVTLVEELRKDGSLERVGGISYLTSLANAVPTAVNAGYYAKIVSEKALLRSLINVSTRVAERGYEDGVDGQELIDEAEKLIFSLAERKTREGFSSIRDVAVEAFEQIGQTKAHEGVIGIPTFKNLDYYLSGLQDSDLIIVAARPAMGKTSFCLNIAQNSAVKYGKTVAVFSLE